MEFSNLGRVLGWGWGLAVEPVELLNQSFVSSREVEVKEMKLDRVALLGKAPKHDIVTNQTSCLVLIIQSRHNSLTWL